MIFCTLYSSSSGNSFLFSDGDTSILFDAGVSMKKISEALSKFNLSFDDISAIFVSHEHTDHTKALEAISKKYSIPIHAKYRCGKEIASTGSTKLLSNLYLHESDYSVTIGKYTISSFKTPHDSNDSAGYTIIGNCHKYGIATDCGCLNDVVIQNLIGSDAVIIEANHDVSMLKNGPYPEFLKSRILSDYGHLSNENCAKLAQKLYEGGTKNFILAHLSKQNNLPSLALKAVKASLPIDAKVVVASPDEITTII